MINVDSIEIYTSPKVLSPEQAVKVIEDHKASGKKVGLCHGGFDLVHPGHTKHFEAAKSLCDILGVSITSDQFIPARKGKGRPIYPEQLRAYAIASIEYVDYVVVTDFKKGVEIIDLLKPSVYIKGPDYKNKETPGIKSEREAIKKVGGQIVYTSEPPMSTTKIINYIKNEIDREQVLVVIDRDGTIIEDNNFLGKNDAWKDEMRLKTSLVSYLSYLQTKYSTTKVVITNQAGVARRYFDCERVEEINSTLNEILVDLGINIDNWQYCPYVDSSYASAHIDLNLDPKFIQDQTKRKPNVGMVIDSLKDLGKDIKNFDKILVLGDRHEDKNLAKNLNAVYLDAKLNDYSKFLAKFS